MVLTTDDRFPLHDITAPRQIYSPSRVTYKYTWYVITHYLKKSHICTAHAQNKELNVERSTTFHAASTQKGHRHFMHVSTRLGRSTDNGIPPKKPVPPLLVCRVSSWFSYLQLAEKTMQYRFMVISGSRTRSDLWLYTIHVLLYVGDSEATHSDRATWAGHEYVRLLFAKYTGYLCRSRYTSYRAFENKP